MRERADEKERKEKIKRGDWREIGFKTEGERESERASEREIENE